MKCHGPVTPFGLHLPSRSLPMQSGQVAILAMTAATFKGEGCGSPGCPTNAFQTDVVRGASGQHDDGPPSIRGEALGAKGALIQILHDGSTGHGHGRREDQCIEWGSDCDGGSVLLSVCYLVLRGVLRLTVLRCRSNA